MNRGIKILTTLSKVTYGSCSRGARFDPVRGTGFLRLSFVSFFFESLDAVPVIESQIRERLLATKSFPSHSISPHYTSTDPD